MIFRQLYDAETSSYTYLLGDKVGGEAIIIDPAAAQVEREVAFLERFALTLVYVFLTSSTPQRVRAAHALRAKTGAKVVAGGGGAAADVKVRHEDRLEYGDRTVLVLETPGYTSDCVSYVVGQRVFTGDALSVRSTGRSGAVCADPSRLYESVTRILFSLPPETLVYPAHHRGGTSASTIGAERQFNPELACRDQRAFVLRRGDTSTGLRRLGCSSLEPRRDSR